MPTLKIYDLFLSHMWRKTENSEYMGKYIKHRKRVQEEIKIAKAYNKPIIDVIPLGQERVPVKVQNFAKEMVGWPTSGNVAAIQKWTY